jgi:hypothetical protein
MASLAAHFATAPERSKLLGHAQKSAVCSILTGGASKNPDLTSRLLRFTEQRCGPWALVTNASSMPDSVPMGRCRLARTMSEQPCT